jgi:outer membrane protein TolC
LARARSDQIRAEEHAQATLATLAEWMGLAGEPVEVLTGPLLEEPPVSLSSDAPLANHPLAAAHEADIAVAEARKQSIDKEWRPKFQVQSALYGRGTGARIDGTFQGSTHGLAPSEGNWGVGFNMNFDLFEYKRTRVRSRIELTKVEKEQAERDRVLQGLKGEVARATIAVDAARKVARNTPIELDAARTLETQAQARYKAGLGTVIEVADAHRLLRQAEVDNALAKLGIWRALFALAAVQGAMDELLIAASK